MKTRSPFVAWLALALALAVPACGDRRESPPAPAAAAPLAHAPVRAGGHRFSDGVPRLAGPPRDTLRVEREFGDSLSFGHVTLLEVVGDRLLVGDRFMSPHLSVFDLATGAVKTRLGRDGEGPGELREPAAAFVAPGGAPEVWVYDFDNRRYTLFDVSASGKSAVRRELSLNVGASLMNPAWAGGRIVANGLFPGYTLLFMDERGKPVSRIAADPPFGGGGVGERVGSRQINRNFLAADPSGGRVALAYQHTSRIDFFTADGGRYGSVRGPRPTRASFHLDSRSRLQLEPEHQVAYWMADATRDHVYTLFCGCEMGESGEAALPSLLHVFTWDGEFVAELALDRRLAAFAVSPDGTRLYGATLEPYPSVGEWRLPRLEAPARRAAAGEVVSRDG